jgi:uncharacterized protein YydD (DUF2326 family)
LAKTFYPQSIAGLTINTNEGENQLVFDIEPKIESDGSDGISNVKLFCFDISILFEGENHNMEFIFHDSRLFDGIDERQKTTMFKIIEDNTILTLTDDSDTEKLLGIKVDIGNK